jgi:hypothetical protein
LRAQQREQQSNRNRQPSQQRAHLRSLNLCSRRG